MTSVRMGAGVACALAIAAVFSARLAIGTEPEEECWSITRIEDPTLIYNSPDEATREFGSRMAQISSHEQDSAQSRLFGAMALTAGAAARISVEGEQAIYRAIDGDGRPVGVLELAQLDAGWAVSEVRILLPLEECEER